MGTFYLGNLSFSHPANDMAILPLWWNWRSGFSKCITFSSLTLSGPGMGRPIVKIGHSNLGPGSKELITVNVARILRADKIPNRG